MPTIKKKLTMWCKKTERKNATKHKINCLHEMSKSFSREDLEYLYLINRIGTMKIMLKDDTYTL